MYYCDGCHRVVAGTAKDPIHWPGSRKLGTCCLHLPEAPRASGTSETPEVPKTSRADAARARWAAKSDEEKRAHVAKMQAGRGLRTKEAEGAT
jgi:hypothetical protein